MAKALKATFLILALILLAAIPAVASAKTENSGVTSRITAQQGPPSVSISAAANVKVRLNSPVPVTATFSEPVSGFTVDDISVGNGAASGFSGSDGVAVYTFDVTPTSLGEVTVDIAAGAATDGEGSGNAAAPQLFLGIPYDFDGNGGISKNEAIAAVVDYFAGSITKAQTIAVIVLYFSAPAEPEPGPSDDCIQTVTSDGTLDGQWASGCDSEDRSGSHARYYRFTLDASSEVTVTPGIQRSQHPSVPAAGGCHLRDGAARERRPRGQHQRLADSGDAGGRQLHRGGNDLLGGGPPAPSP